MITLHGIEYDNTLAETKAREALDILTEAYPGYSWKPTVKGGVCFIRLLDPRLRGNWGMNIKMRDVDHDSAVFKRKIKYVAGEFLERCGLRRREAEFMADLKRVEGVPEKHQPLDLTKKPDVAKVEPKIEVARA